MSEPVLTAFYDLEVSPISFDFAVFAVLAERERRRLGASGLRFFVVPAAGSGFRSDDAEYDEANKVWRLYNIVVPIAAMLERSDGITLCRSREHARDIAASLPGPVFPEGYNFDAPRAAFLWSEIVAAATIGEEIPSLRAGPQARTYMGAWLRARVGERRAVTITLRESSHAAVRNSNVEAWLSFARELDPTVYCPVILRDTEKVFETPPKEFDGLLLCEPATVNLELRMALYELAWLNLMVPNGPTELCRLSDTARYIVFRMVNEDWPSTTRVFLASHGLSIGGQLPHATPFQRQVWEPDELPVIRREFESMARRIGTEGRPVPMKPDPAHAYDPMETAVRLQLTGRLEEATAIYQKIVQEDPDNADAWHMLAIIAHQAGRLDAAEKMIGRAIALRPERANFFVSLGAVMRDTGRAEEAVKAFLAAVSRDPEDAGAHADLAEVLMRLGRAAEAQQAMARALELKPGEVGYYERAARLLEEAGDVGEAVKFYRRAVELRSQLETEVREAARHMAEVPRITLGQG